MDRNATSRLQMTPRDTRLAVKGYEDRLLYRFVSPIDRVLTLEGDQHPAFFVLPERRSPGFTHFLEKTLEPERNV